MSEYRIDLTTVREYLATLAPELRRQPKKLVQTPYWLFPWMSGRKSLATRSYDRNYDGADPRRFFTRLNEASFTGYTSWYLPIRKAIR